MREDEYYDSREDDLDISFIENKIVDEMPDAAHLAVYALLCRMEGTPQYSLNIEYISFRLGIPDIEVAHIVDYLIKLDYLEHGSLN